MFNTFFSSVLYVKVYKNKFVVKNLANNLSSQIFTSDTPFTTTRLLIGTFAPAAQCLKHAVRSSTSNAWFIGPKILIQPMEMNDDGLSEVEDRILRECALSSGARKIVVWIGTELSDAEVIEKINSPH